MLPSTNPTIAKTIQTAGAKKPAAKKKAAKKGVSKMTLAQMAKIDAMYDKKLGDK